jgi:hypothetical protein
MFDQDVSSKLKEIVRRELAGERLIWAGRPNPRSVARSGFGLWFFAVPWTAFALFWEATAIRQFFRNDVSGGSLFLVFWGIPFVLIGLAMLAAPLWMARRAGRTVYVLTERRLVELIDDATSTQVKSIWPKDILSITKSVRADGSGTIKLSFGSKRDSEGDLVEKAVSIDGVRNVDELEHHLLELRTAPAV